MNASVLVVDDSQTIHAVLDLLLRNEPVVLHHAFNAEQGLKMSRDLQPDLILLDVTMPDLPGFEVCRRLKADPATASLQIIFLSAATEVAAKVAGFDLGAVDYVTKPFEPAELCARVRAALRTKRYQDLLASRAQIDGLTALRNRRYFDQRLEDEMSAAHRYNRKVSLVMLDIDHFKRLNDAYGHPFGDMVLQAAADTLTKSLRDSDAACRYGGEEFGIILTQTAECDAAIVAERLRTQIAALSFETKSGTIGVTASLGVVSSERFFDRETLTRLNFVGAADEALYDAKRGGRNRICVAAVCSEAAETIETIEIAQAPALLRGMTSHARAVEVIYA